MKRISIVCLTGLLLLTACHDSGSSTVGTYEQEQTTESSEKSENGSHHGAAQEAHEAAGEGTENRAADTLKAPGDTTTSAPGTEDSTSLNGTEKH